MGDDQVMSEAREDCEACQGTGRCPRCRGERYREVAGGVRVACSECDGTGRCPACGKEER